MNRSQPSGQRVGGRLPTLSTTYQQAPPASIEDNYDIPGNVPPPKKARQQSSSGLGRFAKNVIELEQLSVLVASYHKHFGVYCKEKRTKVT